MKALGRRYRLVAAVLLFSGLAGCGYRPLYGSAGGDVESSLASVRVEEQRNRLAQFVRNELITGLGSGESGAYRLKLTVDDGTSTIVTYPDPKLARRAAVVEVKYELFGEDSRKPLTEGRVESRVSYDLTDTRQPFADRQVRTDAEERAAREIAADIRTRLAVYFSRRS
jgi:LPS-assembly lipoprotein